MLQQKRKALKKLFNKRGEEGIGGEIAAGIVTTGVFVWIAGEIFGWGHTIMWILIVIGGIIGLGYLLRLLSDAAATAVQRKIEKENIDPEKQKLIEEQRRKLEEKRRLAEEAARIAKEQESLIAFKEALKRSSSRAKFSEATKIINMLAADTDKIRKERILDFFNKYLPIMTESIEASGNGKIDIDDTIDTFTKTVKSFADGLYNAEDVVETNKALMESFAIRDGLYDPYEVNLTAETEKIKEQKAVENSGVKK